MRSSLPRKYAPHADAAGSQMPGAGPASAESRPITSSPLSFQWTANGTASTPITVDHPRPHSTRTRTSAVSPVPGATAPCPLTGSRHWA